MEKKSPADLIETYQQRQKSRSRFNFADISKIIIIPIILIPSIYILLIKGLAPSSTIESNTPTYTPTITPTSTNTQLEAPTAENLCDCKLPKAQIVIVTATFGNTYTPSLPPSKTITATATHTPTKTSTPTSTPTSPTSTPSVTPTPTQIVYTVQQNDTLSYIALKFNVTVEEIQMLNNLDTTFIYEGQILLIPRPK